MSEQQGNASDKDASGLIRRFPRLKPQRRKTPPSQPDKKTQQEPKKSDVESDQPKPRIPIWIDGQGEILIEIPRGVPGGYHGQIVDLSYLDQTIGEKQRKFEATMVVGDLNGLIGIGSARSESPEKAIKKAMKNATSNTFKVLRDQTTLTKEVKRRVAGVEVTVSPAEAGSGITAPPSVQSLLELAGIKDASVSLPDDIGANDIFSLRMVARALRLQTHLSQRSDQPTRVSRGSLGFPGRSTKTRLSPLSKRRASK